MRYLPTAFVLAVVLAPFVVTCAESPADARPAKRGEWCGTMPALRIEAERSGSLDGPYSLRDLCDRGACDTVAVRNATEVFPLTVRVIVHVMRDEDGSGGASQQAVDETVARMNADFAPMGFQFINMGTLFHDDSTYFCVPAYDSTNAWYDVIQSMKIQYAQTPEWACNIFISCMEAGPDSLWGYGCFPWSSYALAAEGGIWLNADISVGAEFVTPTHEMGHNLGLWHTHHGVDEVDECGACYEYASGFLGNRRGDFCKDTPPTPTNWTCAPPGGVDCLGDPWGETAYRNYMGYGPDDCCDEFTSQQRLRLHCWTKDRLLGWLSDPVVGSPAPVTGSAGFGLDPSVPNPFEPQTTVSYTVPSLGLVQLMVYDIAGRPVSTLVKTVQPGGSHSTTWNGCDDEGNPVPSGVYFYRLVSAGQVETRKVVRIAR